MEPIAMLPFLSHLLIRTVRLETDRCHPSVFSSHREHFENGSRFSVRRTSRPKFGQGIDAACHYENFMSPIFIDSVPK